MKKSLIIFLNLILFFSLVTFAQAQEEYEFLRKWSTTKDTWQNPTGVALDKDGYVYVAGNQKIVKYASDGTYVFHIENIPNSDKFFFSSHEMKVAVDDSGYIYVSLWDNNMVVKFDPLGDYDSKWDSWTDGTLQSFNQPAGLAVDDSGNVYVCDAGNHRIVKFDSSGEWLATWERTGGGNGGEDRAFHWPRDIAIFDSSNIYVIEQHNHRVQVFNSDGTFQRKWGEYGTADGKFKYPEGIAVDFEGNVYTVDQGNNHRITKFSSTGTLIDTTGPSEGPWGGYGDDNYHFHDPKDVDVDHSGNVIIVDSNNYRIIEYKRAGAPTVEIANPVQDEFVKGTVSIEANVTVPNGFTIDTVEFYIDETLLGEDSSPVPPSYDYDWNTLSGAYPNGSYTVWIIATNTEGAKTREKVPVIVSNGDVAPSAFSISYPADQEKIWGTKTIEASTSDENGITKVEFYVDDSLVNTDNVSPSKPSHDYSYDWDTTTVNDGEKVLKVIFYDTIGQFASDTITVTVKNQEEIGYITKWYTDNPTDVVLDSDGNLYVSGNHRIKKYAPDGTYISTIEHTGNEDFDLDWYLFIAIDNSGNIYACNQGNHNIVKFDSNGNYVTKWGSFGEDNDQFHNPEGIACDSEGNVYVSDQNNHRISKFSSTGTFIISWGTQGGGDGQFNNPRGIAIDASDNVYVVDSHNNRVQVFTSNGTFQKKWSNAGSGENHFDCPRGIALDSLGNFYITDDCYHRILQFASDGTFITKWGSLGSGDLQFHSPRGIAVDADFYVYVADRNNNRVVKFRSTWLPTIEITNPTDNLVVSKTVIIKVTASSAILISKVEFYIDDALKSTNTESPYEYLWDTTEETDGTYTLKAIAYNSQDTSQETDEISVVVNNNSDAPPTVSITNPAEGDIIRLTTNLQAKASELGMDRVEFYVDDVKVGEDTDNTDSTYEYTWDATSVEDGERVIKIVAFDTIGQNVGESITVTVINHEEFDYMTKWSLDRPADVVLDKNGYLYVAGGHMISKYTPDGTLISRIENISSDYNLTHWFCIAVDNLGNIYITNPDRNQVIKFDSNLNYLTKWGSYGEGNYQFHAPRGIAVDSDGYVYVCDSNNNRISKFSSDGTFEKAWGSSGGNDGLFQNPYSIAIDPSNNIYVADSDNNRIQVFSSDGIFIRKWGQWGYEDHQLRSPRGIALDSEGNVYVADTSNYKVVKYTSDGTFLAKWGSQGSGDLQFECMYGIAVDSDFYVYVADHCNNRITKFKSDWRPTVEITYPADNSVLITSQVTIKATASSDIEISKVEFYINGTKEHEDTTGPSPYTYDWNTSSEQNGAFTIKAIAYNTQNTSLESEEIYVVVNNKDEKDGSPSVSLTNPAEGDTIRLTVDIQAVATDPEGLIDRVEFYVDEVKVGEGTTDPYEYTWDATTVEDGEKVIKAIAYDTIGQNVEESITVTVTNHEEFGYVSKWSGDNPSDVAVDKDGYVYVAGDNKIAKYTPDGILVFRIEYTGNEEFYLDWWFHIAVDANGNIYASENDSHNIVKFDSNGNYLFKWGTYGHGDYQFYNPHGIAADSEGNVYICDYNNNRIVKYDSEGTLVTEWGSQGGNDSQFNNPYGIAVDSSNNIYVTDRHNNRIQVFDSDGVFLRRWGTHGYEDNQFRNPFGIAVDSEDNVYIVDRDNYRIVKYTSTGTFLAKWGTLGSNDLQFDCPNGIAVDSYFNVYVADSCNNRIIIFKSIWRPTVEITNPADNEVIGGDVTIQATVESAIGISKVEFYINGTNVGEDTTNAYEYEWDTTSEANGAYTIKAIAYNIQNTTSESDEIYVVVKNIADAPPTVSITNPADGDTIRLTTNLQAEASDTVGIDRVEFYVDGTLVDTATLPETPTSYEYSYSWNAAAVEDGERVIKVVAFDTIGQNVEESIIVTVTNHEEFGYVSKWSGDNPFDVAVDKDGYLYVAGNSKIQKYTPDGTLVYKIEYTGNEEYYLDGWFHIAVDTDGNIYATDDDNHNIIKFDSNGNYITQWGSYGQGDYQFSYPNGIATDSEGNVYVCDYHNNRIVKYDSEGTLLTEWGTQGGSDGEFNNPFCIAVDSSNNIYVTDRYGNRIQVFDSDGEFLRRWGSHGYEDTQFRNPRGIAVDSEDNVYIVDGDNYRVVKYTSNGTFLAKWGSQGSGNLQFESPYGIAVDSDFYVYVADEGNNRITKFKSTWRPTVEIAYPDDNEVITGSVTIQATASSDIEISKVEFYINGSLAGEATTTNPDNGYYEYYWDTTSKDNGPYTIKAIAYNIQNTTSESDEIYVVVNNKDEKDGSPLVSITNPAEGDIIRLTVDIQAEASDLEGIDRVEFYVDGTLVDTATLPETPTSYEYSYSWNAAAVEDGERVIKVVVYDTIGQNVEESITVTVTNHEEFGYLTKWGHDSPTDVAVDKNGDLYIAGGHSISKFTPDGILIYRIGEQQGEDYYLSWWMHIAIDDSGNIYASNRDRNSIVKFDSNGNYITQWGNYGSGNYQFNNPYGIAVDSEGNVYICDQENHRISKFNSDGVFLATWGTQGHLDGQLQSPMGITVDSSDNIFVTDHNHRVQVFNSDGESLRKWGNHGYSDTQFRWPQGIAVDSEGYVYVSDTGNYRVVKYTNDGTFLAKFGNQGSGDLQFECPNSITVDSDFNVYVTDNCNNRVTIFKSTWLPSVEITYPADNDVIIESVTIQATASSAIGISKVEFYINEDLVGGDTNNPYEYFWDTSAESEGTYTIKAIAYNIQNITTESDEISVVVNNSTNEAPTVSITSPQDGEIIRKWVDIEADASDDFKIDKVEFYISDTLVSTNTEAPYVYTWNTTTVGDGETEIKVVAFDTIGQNTSASIMVKVANQEAYEYVTTWDIWDYGHPNSITFDKSGHFYVTFHESIIKFTSTGSFLSRIDNEGSDNNYQLTCCMNIAVDDSGNIYVSNQESHTIIKFDSSGNYLTKWGSQGDADDQFNAPAGIAVDNEGYVYVCDADNHRIVKHDSNGTFIAKWGSQGHADGQFQYPVDIAVDDENNIYVAEQWNNRIQILDSEGTFLRKFGNWGYGDGEFQNLRGIALDSEGNVYAADENNHRISKFSSEGTFITKWGSYGSGENQLQNPRDVAVDSSGNVYVADHSNRRIMIFRIIGTPSVVITNPSDNSTVSGTVMIQADAESEFGINRVDFYVIDGELIGTATEPTTGITYEYSWDTILYSNGNGSHEIKAVAYNTDLKSTETSVSVIVNNGGDLAPTVSITNLKDDAVIRDEINIKADISDNFGINKVELYVDETLVDTVTLSPAPQSYEYIYTWDTTTVADGERELKVQAYDTIGQKTWARITVTVDNANNVFSVDLSQAAVIYINTENKLRKIDLNGNINPVINTDPEVGQFQFGPQGNLYIVFWHPQELRDGNSYILVKVNPETNEYQGIDSSLTSLVWLEYSTTKNLQFDQQGNIYYFAHADVGDNVWERVLRKYVDENNIEDIINRDMEIYHWLVRDDGTIVIAGKTRANNETWLRKVNPIETLPEKRVENIAEPDWWWEWGWMAKFPDNLVYVTLNGSYLNLDGVYRLADDLPRLKEEDAETPYIGDKEGSLYKIDDLIAGHSEEYIKGIIDMGRVQQLVNYEIDDSGNVYGLCGHRHNKYRTVLKLYPEPEVIEPQLIDRAQAMQVSLNQLIIAGFNNTEGQYKLLLYDISTKNEINLMYQNIEIYHLDVLSNGNIIFDGLNLDTNKVIVGMFERAAGASSDLVRALGGYGFKELAELGGRPLSFGVFKEVSGSEVVLVSITSVANGSTVSGVVKIQAGASSPEGVERVEFYIDGELIATDTTLPYSYSWDTTVYSDGSHTIKVKMYDKASQTAVHEIPVIVNNMTSPGEIVLSTNQIFFAASTETSPTSDQKLVIENSGGMALNWTATVTESWIQVSPTSGTGSGIITVSPNTSGLSVGTYTGNITIKDPNASNSPQWVKVNLKIYSSVSVQKPFGAFETPQDGTTGITGALPLTGWALDDIEVTKVEIWRDPVGGEPTAENGMVYIGDAMLIEGARPDVAEMYPNYPLSYQAGWGYLLLTNYLPNDGNGTYTLYAVAYDKEGNKADLGTKTISCDNSSASEPFGTIDTPTEGGEASGGTFINFGWALTPQPNSILTDGSTITVYVNGEDLGNPVYGQYRSDVANLFPGYANTDGAVGYFYLDTTEYRNGVHVIAWNVEDSGGNSADIGTKYFTIVNVDVMGSFSTGMGGYRVDPGTAPAFRYVDNIPTSFKSVRVRSGNRRNVEPVITEVDHYGVTNIAIREVERVQVELGEGTDYEGYMIVGGALKPLPAGSTLNTEERTFSWQPGAGFIGEYYLVFIKKDATGAKTKIKTRITILPKFSIY